MVYAIIQSLRKLGCLLSGAIDDIAGPRGGKYAVLPWGNGFVRWRSNYLTQVSGLESTLIVKCAWAVLIFTRCHFIFIHEQAERSVSIVHLDLGQGLLSSLGSGYGLKDVVLDGGCALM